MLPRPADVFYAVSSAKQRQGLESSGKILERIAEESSLREFVIVDRKV